MFLQDFTAWVRAAVQGTAMVEQLIRVVKVLAVQQKSPYLSGSDILNLVNRQTMQTVHYQTLLLREAYLDGFSVHDLPVIDQQKLRSN